MGEVTNGSFVEFQFAETGFCGAAAQEQADRPDWVEQGRLPQKAVRQLSEWSGHWWVTANGPASFLAHASLETIAPELTEYDHLRGTWGLDEPVYVALRDPLRQAARDVLSRSELI